MDALQMLASSVAILVAIGLYELAYWLKKKHLAKKEKESTNA